MEPSQPIEEEPHEEQHHIGKRGKRKRKAHATPTPFVPAKVVIMSPPPPLPPFAPMSPNNKRNMICTLMILHQGEVNDILE